jgi:hypothetical protein
MEEFLMAYRHVAKEGVAVRYRHLMGRSVDIGALKEASPDVNPDAITASGVGRYVAQMDHQVTGLIEKVVAVY